MNKDEQMAARLRAETLEHAELLQGRAEVPEQMHIGHLIASTAEYNEIKPLTARVWVPGFRDPVTKKLGMIAEVCKPSPDNEIRIYSKSREKHIPEEAAQWLLPEQVPTWGKQHRWETIWKLVYCCVKPVVTFDWAAKIMTLAHGGDVIKPLIDKIDELMATPTAIDNLTGGNIMAYPTLLGGAKIAARDGKLAEYFGSLDKGVAQAIFDNMKTMLLIQAMVLREDAELQAVIKYVVNAELRAGEYEPPFMTKEALRDPWGAYMARLEKRATGESMKVAQADAARYWHRTDDDLPPLPDAVEIAADEKELANAPTRATATTPTETPDDGDQAGDELGDE